MLSHYLGKNSLEYFIYQKWVSLSAPLSREHVACSASTSERINLTLNESDMLLEPKTSGLH